MARLAILGGETRDYGSTTVAGAEGTITVTAAAPTAETTITHSGFGVSFKFAPNSTAPRIDYTFSGGATGRNYYLRAYVNFTNYPSSQCQIMAFQCGGGLFHEIVMTTTGTLFLGDIGSPPATVALNTGQWYKLELRIKVGVSSNTELEFRVDGVSIASTNTLGEAAAPTNFRFGYGANQTNGKVMYFDDVVLNDDQGANQNSWPPDSYVTMLFPISDNARGSWVSGSASGTGTTNLWDAINNTPPVGTASPMATTAGISNAISGATSPNGDFNMTSYSTAGLGSNDTVNLVQMVIVHGEDVSTGAKTGTFNIQSNPALSTDNVAQGGTNQFGPSAGGAVGTYPTNWVIQRGTVSYSPTVTIANSPVGRISKTDTGTRAADLCFMGIWVDYTTGVAPLPTGRTWTPASTSNNTLLRM